MPALDANRNASRTGTKKATRKPKKYSLPSGPRGDAPATRKGDFKKANAYKKTKPYTSAIKAAYKSSPVADRQKRVGGIASEHFRPGAELGRGAAKARSKRTRLSPEDRAVLGTYLRRAARDRVLMQSKPNARQSKIIEAHKKTPEYAQALRDAQHVAEMDKLAKANPKNASLFEADPAKLKAAGFKTEGFLDKAAKLPAVTIEEGAALATAAYHDPIGVPFKTAKQLPTVLKAIPGGAREAVTHPIKTAQKATDNAAGRGAKGFDEHVKTIRKEGGAAEAVDVALAIGAGSVAGGATREVIKAGLRKAGREVADAYIPAGVRVSGGRLEPRRIPKGLIGEATVRASDKLRGSNLSFGVGKVKVRGLERKRRDAAAGKGKITPLQHAAAEANRKAGRIVEVPSRRERFKFANPLHHNVAMLRGRAVHALHYDSGSRLKADAKQLAKLDTSEKRALYYAATYGIRTAKQAVEHLGPLLEDIKAYRAEHGIEATGNLKKHDMVPELAKILANPEAHFTSKLDSVLEDLRPDLEKAGREDPRYTPDILAQRVTRPQAELLNMERGVAEPAKKGDIDLGATKPTGKNGNGDFMGDADLEATWGFLQGEPNGTTLKVAKGSGRVSVERYDGDGKLVGRLAFDVGPSEHSEHGVPQNLDVVVHSTKKRNGVAKSLYARAAADGYDVENGHTAAQSPEGRAFRESLSGGAALPGLRYFDEADMDFVKRVAAQVEKQGLAKPLYFREDRYGDQDFGAHAVGGTSAVKADRANRGLNRQVGIIDTSPAALLQGKARNIKAKHNWNLVDKILDSNRLRELAGDKGDTASAIRARAAEAGIDSGTYALWNPRVYREHAQQAGERADTPELDHADLEEAEGGHVLQALQASTVKPGDIKLASGGGWHAVPLETLRELEAETTPSGAAGRSIDVTKGKMSRAILGVANVPWLQFQVANNAAAAALVTGGRALNPKNWVDSARWWNHDMTPEQRAEVGSLIGTDTTASDSRQVRMGATVNGGFANAYRALKAHPMWHTGIAKGHGPSISQLNPIDAMFRADRAETSAFRILTAYSQHKKAAVRSMGENMGLAEKTWSSITHILQKPPAEMMRELADNRELLEHNAQSVADYMGDFTTLTAHERKVLNRAVMFYPYVRYSLKLVFWTMPTKHPVMTALLAELGVLNRDELEKLFGGDQLPWNAGKIYFGDDGHVKSIDLARANPALNAVMDAVGSKNPGQLAGVMPPVVGWGLDQLGHRSFFKDREWNTLGKAGAYGAKSSDYGLETRARIAINSALSLTYPYREAVKVLNPGPQGDDSLLWSPRETVYKGTTTTGKLQKKFAARRDAFAEEHDSLINRLIPLLPQDNRDAENAREAAIVKRSEQPAKKRGKKGNYFGGGSSGTHYFGAGG